KSPFESRPVIGTQGRSYLPGAEVQLRREQHVNEFNARSEGPCRGDDTRDGDRVTLAGAKRGVRRTLGPLLPWPSAGRPGRAPRGLGQSVAQSAAPIDSARVPWTTLRRVGWARTWMQ